MPNTKISALTSATTPLAGTEVLPIVQSSTTKKVAVSDLTAGRDVLASRLGIGGAISGSYIITVYGGIYSTTGDNYFAGQLGIGTTPTYKLDALVGAGSGNILRAGQSGISNGLTITTNGSTLTYTFDTGNIVIGTAGKGIDFTANTGNVLTQYKEGTWTPGQGAGVTVVGTFSSSGTYTRIGRLVFLKGVISGTTSVAVGAGAEVVNNLPFTPTAGAIGGMGNAAYSTYTGIRTFSGALYAIVAQAATTSLAFSICYEV